MPRISRLNLPPVDIGGQTIGQRLAQLRKKRGYTQKALAKKMGLIQSLISAYERDKLRLTAEMLIRFCNALKVSADDILKTKNGKKDNYAPSLKIARRAQKIESLPASKQKSILKVIDALVRDAEK